MVSELELKVRAMDDESKSVWRKAKEIAELIGVNAGTANVYLTVKRKGYGSLEEYNDHRAQKNGLGTGGRLCHAERLVKRGQFDSLEDVKAHLIRRGILMENVGQYIIESVKSNGDYSLEGINKEWERKEEINRIINGKLNEKEKKVIRGLFLEEKTSVEIMKDLSLTRVRVYQIRNEALEKLGLGAKASGLYDLYVGYGVD
jgi:hypothetical protein